jgi:TM2 domain-containing membrane protein YozV
VGRGYLLSNQTNNNQDTSTFPAGLLIAGYGTAGLGALLLSMFGAGILATGLTFWLGGAVAVIIWGGVWAYSRKTTLPQSKCLAEFPAAPREAVSAK